VSLYQHHPHPHRLRNVNSTHKAEQQRAGLNQRFAIAMTNVCQSMFTFWLILASMLFWMVANALIIRLDPPPWNYLLVIGSLVQLPLQLVIMIGQSVLSRHQELQADEAYQATMKSFSDVEQIMAHLDSQDQEILRQEQIMLNILERVEAVQTPARTTKKKSVDTAPNNVAGRDA
jgi:uncharacterized membrane protein